MTEKRFTRTEINKIVHNSCINYYRMYGDDMSLSKRLFFYRYLRNY